MGELGDRLRQAREAKGLTLEQVEEITKIRRCFLQALELEDYGQLPGEVYVRGFLRNYAQALGLDPEEVVAVRGHQVTVQTLPAVESQEPLLDEPLAPPLSRQPLMAALIGLMVVIALGVGAWTFYRYLGPTGAPPTLPPPESPTLAPVDLPATPEASAAAGEETTAAALPPALTQTAGITLTEEPTQAPPTGAAGMGILLRLEATQQCWLRVTVDGRLAYEGMLEVGQVQEWQGSTQVFIRAGNAGGLRLWYNGQEQSPLGAQGEVAERTWGASALPTPGGPEPSSQGTPGPLGPPPAPQTAAPTVTAAPEGKQTAAPGPTATP